MNSWIVLLAFLASGMTAAVAQTAPPPGKALADDLAAGGPKLVDGYAASRPRLLFGGDHKPALQKAAAESPQRWKAVIDSSKRLAQVPSAEDIRNGKGYWRIERVQSGALAAFVTGEAAHRDAALKWMLAVCKQDTWGTAFRPNLDLEASWYLYHLSIAYDLLHAELSDADRQAIRDGLAAHARLMAEEFEPAGRSENFRYDQNHTYIPATALATASLALLGEVPEAQQWLTLAYHVMRRSRHVQSEDGYYYEGFGYWTYALHWHVRYADLMSRATGQNLFEAPFLINSWRFALHLSLPGHPGAFDMHDTGSWKGDKRSNVKVTNHGMLWGIAGATASAESRVAGDLYDARQAELDYPAAAFMWSAAAAKVEPAKFDAIPPRHYFADHDVITWRSGWDADATALLFRCGPPAGHAAARKLKDFTDWTMNAGHVHPDIGAFYFYARGTYLATSTGYTAEKWTKDHNTLLIDGKGQAVDGAYHNERGVPYDQLDACRIEAHKLTEDYAYARGTFGSAYTRQVNGVDLRRTVLATRGWLLLIDDMSSAEPHALTWLCHTDAPFKADGTSHVAKLEKASLAVLPLAGEVNATAEPTTVIAGTAPRKGTPTQRGHHLALTMKSPAKTARIVNLLVPLANGDAPPTVADAKTDGDTVTFSVKWANGKTETVTVRLNDKDEPVTLK